ncbi:6372_t:CDS:2 [Entrophospora sp. SA101]|nr:6372_t:CDS:2 [Entrophospora sp. SA101]
MKSKEATAQENKKEVITYYLYLLEKPVLVNERTIKHILISSHCDKHEKHGISKETIIELIQLLNNRYFPFSGKQPEKKNYFKVYPESHNKSVSEKTKYQFSQAITRHQVKNNLSETEIANKLDLDRQTTTRLLRGYVENFSLDSLTGYVEKLHLPLQIKVSV